LDGFPRSTPVVASDRRGLGQDRHRPGREPAGGPRALRGQGVG